MPGASNIECMFEHVGVGDTGVLVHDVSVVDSMIHYARVSNIAESGKFRAIADLVALRVDDQEAVRRFYRTGIGVAACADPGVDASRDLPEPRVSHRQL